MSASPRTDAEDRSTRVAVLKTPMRHAQPGTAPPRVAYGTSIAVNRRPSYAVQSFPCRRRQTYGTGSRDLPPQGVKFSPVSQRPQRVGVSGSAQRHSPHDIYRTGRGQLRSVAAGHRRGQHGRKRTGRQDPEPPAASAGRPASTLRCGRCAEHGQPQANGRPHTNLEE